MFIYLVIENIEKREEENMKEKQITMDFTQISKTSSNSEVATAVAPSEKFTTAIADKTHLANLISSLKSELASANSLLKLKEKECSDSKEQFKRNATELRDARKRITAMEKQSENYRETVCLELFNALLLKLTFFYSK